MGLRDELMAPVLTNATITSMLGNGVDSIVPRAGVAVPAKAPWLMFKMSSESVVDKTNPIYRVGGFSWWIYDDPGEQYYRIDDLTALLLKAYPYDLEINFPDDAGDGWKPVLALIGGDAVDDEWKQHFKWVEWTLWRNNP